jgi:hypothetical protein
MLPVADLRHQLDTQNECKAEDRGALAMGIGMYGVGLDVALVLVERVEDVDPFVSTARDEAAEQSHIEVGHVVVRDTAKTAIAYVALGEEVPFVGVPLGPVGGNVLG